MQSTGTAERMAAQFPDVFVGIPIIVLQGAVMVLSTLFTLIMYSFTTVLLVPFAVNIALDTIADPAAFALTVAISTLSSFSIPTH